MLTLRGVNQYYGASHTLRDLDLQLETGKVFCLMGRNGVGKTTTLNTILGLSPARSGSVSLGTDLLDGLSVEARVKRGIGYVPQGRMIFPDLTVLENLRLALAGRSDRKAEIPDQIFEFFPVLAEMAERRGGDLSGGQQQQLAIGRALVLRPRLLLLDEPCEGIQPNIVQLIGDVLRRLRDEQGMTILLVEQKLPFARAVGDNFAIMDRGSVVARGAMPALSEALVSEYLTV
jgi:urea transport system ATP-binding protein